MLNSSYDSAHGITTSIHVSLLFNIILSVKSIKNSSFEKLYTYLAPLSYGIPSALGACDFLEVKVNTINVAMYGIIL